MLETSARLLQLLTLLSARRDWSGPQLAARLKVSTRTVRNDIGKLRTLGYPIEATPGVLGGYRMGIGSELPPLLLNDDEAVAVAVGLRTLASGGISGVEETSISALAKLEHVLPARLRRRVGALQKYTLPGETINGPSVSADVLTQVATACSDHERLRFTYRDKSDTTSRRHVEPYRLVHAYRRWYLVAWDLDRDDWRTFRVDRLSPKPPTSARFSPRELPTADVAEYVQQGARVAWRTLRARIRIDANPDALTDRVPAEATLEDLGDGTTLLEISADSYRNLATYLGYLEHDFEVIEPAELRDEVHALAERYTRAAAEPTSPFA